MCSSIWSSDLNQIEKYKACFILDFFKNHGLHNILAKRPIWFTVKNGSNIYKKVLDKTNFNIIKNEKVISVDQDNKIIKTENNNEYTYDQLILSSHSDESFQLLNNKTFEQNQLLSVCQISKK